MLFSGCILPAPFEPGEKTTALPCPNRYSPGIIVEIYDAASGEPAADDVLGYVLDGAYADTLRPHGMTGEGKAVSLQGAHERAGTYTVVIKKSGYAEWSVEGIVVKTGPCGVLTVVVEAQLEPIVTTARLSYYR